MEEKLGQPGVPELPDLHSSGNVRLVVDGAPKAISAPSELRITIISRDYYFCYSDSSGRYRGQDRLVGRRKAEARSQ